MSAATPITTTGNQSNKSAQKMKFAVESPAEMCYDEIAVNEADSLKGDNPMRKSEIKSVPCTNAYHEKMTMYKVNPIQSQPKSSSWQITLRARALPTFATTQTMAQAVSALSVKHGRNLLPMLRRAR